MSFVVEDVVGLVVEEETLVDDEELLVENVVIVDVVEVV